MSRLIRLDRRWTLWAVAHELPFLGTGVALPWLSLLTLPVSVGALGLLGDLLGHDARELVRGTGFVVEPGAPGTWVALDAATRLARAGCISP